jgi:hypothetical protein
MADAKDFPDCECAQRYGIGMICGRPDCSQVVAAQKNLYATVKGLVRELSPDEAEQRGFSIPDFRAKPPRKDTARTR